MSMAGAEMRVFTNKEGKTLEAELLWVEDNKAILKLGDGKQAKVPLIALSEADQAFIKTWWEENKDKIRPTDVILTLERKESKRRSNKSKHFDHETGAPISSSSTSYDLHFAGEFKNNAGRDLKDILVNYTIYKRTRPDNYQPGKGDIIEKFAGSHEIRTLSVLGTETFQTEKISCSGKSGNFGGVASSSTAGVLGITVTLITGGQEFLTVHEPANLPDLIKVPEEK